MSDIEDEIKRKILTWNARKEGQSIKFFRNPFKLVPVTEMAEIADKFGRNEILTPNEIRGIVGFKPSDDPQANELRNRNISQSNEEIEMEKGINGKEETKVNEGGSKS